MKPAWTPPPDLPNLAAERFLKKAWKRVRKSVRRAVKRVRRVNNLPRRLARRLVRRAARRTIGQVPVLRGSPKGEKEVSNK